MPRRTSLSGSAQEFPEGAVVRPVAFARPARDVSLSSQERKRTCDIRKAISTNIVQQMFPSLWGTCPAR